MCSNGPGTACAVSREKKPLVTLVPPKDGANKGTEPSSNHLSDCCGENTCLREVALSSVEPEESSAAQGSAACAARESLVDLSEREEEPQVAQATCAEVLPQPDWTESAQSASLTNTLAVLTLAGVPVTNTTLPKVAQSLQKGGHYYYRGICRC